MSNSYNNGFNGYSRSGANFTRPNPSLNGFSSITSPRDFQSGYNPALTNNAAGNVTASYMTRPSPAVQYPMGRTSSLNQSLSPRSVSRSNGMTLGSPSRSQTLSPRTSNGFQPQRRQPSNSYSAIDAQSLNSAPQMQYGSQRAQSLNQRSTFQNQGLGQSQRARSLGNSNSINGGQVTQGQQDFANQIAALSAGQNSVSSRLGGRQGAW